MTDQKNKDSYLDFSYLQEFSTDNAFLIEMIDLCQKNTSLYIEGLKVNFEKRDLVQVTNCLLRIKSTATIMGRNDISILIRQIEGKIYSGIAYSNGAVAAIAILTDLIRQFCIQLEVARGILTSS